MYYIIGNILLGYSKIFNFIKTRIANKCSDTLWKLIVFLQQVQDGQWQVSLTNEPVKW